MSTVLLVRHGLTALTGPVLAGRTGGVHLDDRGRAQAENLARRVATLPLAAVVTSPLDRCVETSDVIAAAQAATPQCTVDERLIECDYGDWTGRALKELVRDPLWKLVQT
jgi:broad specificity phosphatase PhoE